MRKISLPLLGLALFLLMAVLALAIGAVRGFRQEKAQVEAASSSLETVFTSRVETGSNLLTVARRHLPEEDERIRAVAQDIKVLSDRQSPLPRRVEANSRLQKDAEALLGILENSASVKGDSRDMGYVTGLLPQALDQSAQWADDGMYNEAAGAFNKRLNSSFSGFLARLLGMTEAALFTP